MDHVNQLGDYQVKIVPRESVLLKALKKKMMMMMSQLRGGTSVLQYVCMTPIIKEKVEG